MDIEVSLARTKLPVPLASVKRAAQTFLAHAGIHQASLSIVFISAGAMRRLNKKSLGHDHVTDVITFDLGGEGRILDGEIYICPAEAERNAGLYAAPVKKEIFRYLAHGILHLAGHDDATPRQRAVMRKAEDKLLSLIG